MLEYICSSYVFSALGPMDKPLLIIGESKRGLYIGLIIPQNDWAIDFFQRASDLKINSITSVVYDSLKENEWLINTITLYKSS